MAGDGMLMRVRPRLARMTAEQMLGLCEAASRHGNGVIDLTNRANLQIRGVRDGALPDLLAALVAMDLVDGDPALETRRNILIAPDWLPGDESEHIACAFTARLGALPDLPAKVGFAIDAGAGPILAEASADFRVERGEGGGLILRADGWDTGVRIALDEAADAMVALAHWFVDSGGAQAGRARRHVPLLPSWAQGQESPAPKRAPILPGRHAADQAYGVAFGSVAAADLLELMRRSEAKAVRFTPWRTLVLEAGQLVEVEGFLTTATDPVMRVDACPGAPACPQATVETRALATRLAAHVPGRFHVSGCAKGCARSAPAHVTLTGRDGLFDLALDARAEDSPVRAGLHPAQLLTHFGAD